ncbi:MAG: hydrogenase maturation nickel metallochaperone HypA [Planctomycetota bacterium]|nr:hydrogenase maturation nickel metallochaperone HypA [Planctomycetota bacterium]
MHEYSLVRRLISQVLEAIESSPPCNVQEVVVSAGPLSGVEPLLVVQAFDQLKSDTGLRGCRLLIEATDLMADCESCRCSFAVQDFVFRCTTCNSSSITVTAGDEFLLLRVKVLE